MGIIFKRLAIPEVIVIESRRFEDDRGFFMELYKYSSLARLGIKEYFVQDNYSVSKKGVIRGLHYQKSPMAQAKLVRCINGEIFDVSVDIRKGSHTYGQWVGVRLSSQDGSMIYIPVGFAHGFAVLSDFAEVIYKCTKEYSPEDERGIIWDDPDINIKWHVNEPIISEKDKTHPRLRYATNNFE